MKRCLLALGVCAVLSLAARAQDDVVPSEGKLVAESKSVAPGGTLWLTHVEDEATFERYMETIAKIPAIDTEAASEQIRLQLLKEPSNYIDSCREVLAQARPTLKVRGTVSMGHRLREYQRFVEEHEIDLLVMNTKDNDQHAMHGMAYPLAVELRRIPLLLL